MIPEAAVEAAAKALWQTNQHDDEWMPKHLTYIDYLRSEATKALEAAAPIIAAEAWDEGVRAKSEYAYSDDIEPLTNPYRPTP